MNAVFDPKILFITETEWLNSQKKDDFLEFLLFHLDAIDEYDICKINWTDELDISLFEQPQIHPWYQSDLRNPIIATIHQKFYHRRELIPSHDQICDIDPEFQSKVTLRDIHDHFLKLTHSLLEFGMDFFLCLSPENQLSIQQKYIFNPNAENGYSPELINHFDEWPRHLNAVEKFYPANTTDFEAQMKSAIDLIQKQEFEGKRLLFEYEFSNQFKKDIVQATKHRDKILHQITKKLVLTAIEAGQDGQLQDEYILQKKEYRFRVTPRPSSTRIHYHFEKNKIKFLRYYDEGEHDAGL